MHDYDRRVAAKVKLHDTLEDMVRYLREHPEEKGQFRHEVRVLKTPEEKEQEKQFRKRMREVEQKWKADVSKIFDDFEKKGLK